MIHNHKRLAGNMDLLHKNILITGAARRIGRALALSLAREGANIIIHHSQSPSEAEALSEEITNFGRQSWIVQADFNDLNETEKLLPKIFSFVSVDVLINNAAIFEDLDLHHTLLKDWQRHLNINLTAPFILGKAFASNLPEGKDGKIINILDWRAFRPGADHFPYTISKAGLLGLTRSMAVSLAPRIAVNGVALGAILPPNDREDINGLIKNVPAGRWGTIEEVCTVIQFLVKSSDYVTGEIIHVDGGRHLI